MNKFSNHQFDKQAKKYNNYYIDRFISMKCSVDMMIARLFPNAKEITESFAAFEATKFLPAEYSWANPYIVVVCPGDGNTPRTAATFAFRSRWTTYSIDPLLKKTDYGIQRLKCIKDCIQHVKLSFEVPVLIANVHSHAKLTQCLQAISAPKICIINIPCCVASDISKPTREYVDTNIWSEKNKVEIYEF